VQRLWLVRLEDRPGALTRPVESGRPSRLLPCFEGHAIEKRGLPDFPHVLAGVLLLQVVAPGTDCLDDLHGEALLVDRNARGQAAQHLEYLTVHQQLLEGEDLGSL